MITTMVLASLMAATPTQASAVCNATPKISMAVVADTLRSYYEAGATYGDFMASAKQLATQWQENYARGATVLEAPVLERARAIGGSWYILVVAIDYCTDSVNTLPYLAALADSVESFHVRVLLPDAGKPLQESRRTPDGRTATPTIIVMNGNWEEVGSIIERPAPLLEAMAAWTAEGERDIRGRRMEWYKADAGRSTVAEAIGIAEKGGRSSER